MMRTAERRENCPSSMAVSPTGFAAAKVWGSAEELGETPQAVPQQSAE